MTAGTSLLTGIMWHIGSSVEKSVDAVAAVAPHDRETAGLSVLLDDVSQFSIANARLHCQKESKEERVRERLTVVYNLINATFLRPILIQKQKKTNISDNDSLNWAIKGL